jgi:hypothetical protein
MVSGKLLRGPLRGQTEEGMEEEIEEGIEEKIEEGIEAV